MTAADFLEHAARCRRHAAYERSQRRIASAKRWEQAAAEAEAAADRRTQRKGA